MFLFDEPLSNLDAKLRVSTRAEIKNLHQRLQTTTVYVTHDHIEAMTMADKIVVMHDGIVEQVGAPLELYDRPANLFVAGFIGSPAMNMVAGKLGADGWFLTADGTRLPLADTGTARPGQPLVYGARPEAMTLGGPVPLTVAVTEPTGAETHVVGRLGGTDITGVFRDRVTGRPGEQIGVSIDGAAVHLFDAASGARLSR